MYKRKCVAKRNIREIAWEDLEIRCYLRERFWTKNKRCISELGGYTEQRVFFPKYITYIEW